MDTRRRDASDAPAAPDALLSPAARRRAWPALDARLRRAARARTAARSRRGRARARGPRARRRRRRRCGRRALRVDSDVATRGRHRARRRRRRLAHLRPEPQAAQARLAAGLRAETDAYNGLWKADAPWASSTAARPTGVLAARKVLAAGRRARARAFRRALPRFRPRRRSVVRQRRVLARHRHAQRLDIAPAERLERQRATIGAAPVFPSAVASATEASRCATKRRARRVGRGRGAGRGRGPGGGGAAAASAEAFVGTDQDVFFSYMACTANARIVARGRRKATRTRRSTSPRPSPPKCSARPRRRAARPRSSPRTAARPVPRAGPRPPPPVRTAPAAGLQPRHARSRRGGDSSSRNSRPRVAAGVERAASDAAALPEPLPRAISTGDEIWCELASGSADLPVLAGCQRRYVPVGPPDRALNLKFQWQCAGFSMVMDSRECCCYAISTRSSSRARPRPYPEPGAPGRGPAPAGRRRSTKASNCQSITCTPIEIWPTGACPSCETISGKTKPSVSAPFVGHLRRGATARACAHPRSAAPA